ncbi:type I secretion system permease/ATPase [Halioglobus japonicus]|uniref:Type I secretion system permease/ATPase n=1 Tax=Halioglobus japonicus TaxID=930805 RepID=A0AAP8MDX7_9GAMM|nr:type I secretion system permease/ATPase [Halioglobus japonicus]AQA18032.1 type I secretion system permease/ATPase [Halioglobus japonicus]PLW86022.1 type I secretion system permease/ATPase [Halioglobus japonicus]GHD14896.1 ABC transporter [Halioglobus japonicus]
MNHVDDPLLQCLLALCRCHGNASTAEAVMGGLPADAGKLSPGLFERAASRVGLASRLVHRSPEDIEPALLPAVLLLKNERACLLMGWKNDGAFARVIYPELNEAVVDVPREELLASATGTLIVCRPRFKFDQRAPRTGTSERGHWFWDAMRANMPVYRDVLLAAFFINMFALALPLFTMNVYDRVVPNHAVETLWMLAAGVVIVMIADIVLRTMRGYFLDLASRRVDITLSATIMEKVLGIRLEHRPVSVGSYAVNLRSFETLRDFITSASVTTIIDIPFALIFIGVIAWIAWPVLIPIVIGLVLVLGFALSVQGKLKELAETTYRAGAMRNSTLIESLVGLDTIKAMGAESRMQRRWEETTSFLAHVAVQLRLLSSSTMNVSQWAQQMVTMFVIVTGVYLITAGELSMGGLIACTMLSGRIMAPFGQTAGLITQYHNAEIALKTLDEVMDQPVERPPGAQFLSREMFRGEIEFKNVSFAYPGAELDSLSNVSFKISPGERVAILGRVGSGKSTLQKLAMGLYQPTAGAIMIDGIDLRQLDPTELRSRVGYVPQDVTLFYGSLRDNLTVANPQASDAAIVRAVEIANLADFVNRHPQGFDMQIGERGDSLSGGQRKSVALARGVINESPILLMDEPTGSMDHSTEMAVKRKLAEFVEGRTWLVVTHRNSLLEMVDRIIVIDNGKLVADGPRDNVVQALKQGKIGKAQ